jgi:rhodanese-related sulfurtransferase
MVTNFAGNLASSEAWEILSSDDLSRLVDVRTPTELKFVGAPDLSGIGKALITIPLMDVNGNANPNFIAEIEALNHSKDAPLIFICHLGGRAIQAAQTAAQMGYKTYNFANGFSGDADASGHRRSVNGWVAENLPWRQA